MNKFIKVAAASVLAIGAVSANAQVADPSLGTIATGLGQTIDPTLVLVVMDTTNGYSYARNTGFTIDSLFPTTGSPTATLNVLADNNMNTFLSHVAVGDSVSWALMGGYFGNDPAGNLLGTTPTDLGPTGVAKALTTTPTPGAVPNLTLGNFGTFFSQNGGYQQFVSTLNLNLGANTSIVGTSPALGGVWNASVASGSYSTWAGALPNAITGFGTAATLYGLTGNGGTNPLTSSLLKVSNLGSFTLTSAGNLVSAVPLPAAFWLFGSGLMGLAGVGRRKIAA
jgi:hypothetical protein